MRRWGLRMIGRLEDQNEGLTYILYIQYIDYICNVYYMYIMHYYVFLYIMYYVFYVYKCIYKREFKYKTISEISTKLNFNNRR